MSQIAFLDLGAACAELREELDAAYLEVMSSARFVNGEQLAAFEAEFAAHSGATHCVGVGSGFDALVLSLRALGVGPGDEVLVPSHTAVMTWLAVAAVGATPVGVEVNERTFTLDPERLEGATGDRTRAVVPVHLYGRPAEMAPILAWAERHGVRVLADAAQADGARLGGRGLGALGDAAAWSFYPSKNLGAFGDGGCVTSDDAALIERLRRLRNYGFMAGGTADGVAAEVGVNSRLDELQAAFLRVRLRHLDEWNERRRRRAATYLEGLGDLELGLPPRDEGVCVSAWHQFVVRSPQRAQLRAALAERGVATSVHYPLPPSAHPAFSGVESSPRFPIAERLAAEVLSLPVGPHLGASEQQRVIAALHETLG